MMVERAGRTVKEARKKTRASSSPFYVGVIFSCLLSIPLVVNAAGGDDEEGKGNLVRYKKRFVSPSKTQQFKKTLLRQTQSFYFTLYLVRNRFFCKVHVSI